MSFNLISVFIVKNLNSQKIFRSNLALHYSMDVYLIDYLEMNYDIDISDEQEAMDQLSSQGTLE